MNWTPQNEPAVHIDDSNNVPCLWLRRKTRWWTFQHRNSAVTSQSTLAAFSLWCTLILLWPYSVKFSKIKIHRSKIDLQFFEIDKNVFWDDWEWLSSGDEWAISCISSVWFAMILPPSWLTDASWFLFVSWYASTHTAYSNCNSECFDNAAGRSVDSLNLPKSWRKLLFGGGIRFDLRRWLALEKFASIGCILATLRMDCNILLQTGKAPFWSCCHRSQHAGCVGQPSFSGWEHPNPQLLSHLGQYGTVVRWMEMHCPQVSKWLFFVVSNPYGTSSKWCIWPLTFRIRWREYSMYFDAVDTQEEYEKARRICSAIPFLLWQCRIDAEGHRRDLTSYLWYPMKRILNECPLYWHSRGIWDGEKYLHCSFLV